MEKVKEEEESKTYWDVIDSDTLSVGHSTPAFADKHKSLSEGMNENLSDEEDAIIKQNISTKEGERDIIEEASGAIQQQPQQSKDSINDDVAKSNSGLKVKRSLTFIQLDVELDGSIPYQSVTVIHDMVENEVNGNEIDGNQVLIRDETVSPAEEFDVPSIDTSKFDDDDLNRIKDSPSILMSKTIQETITKIHIATPMECVIDTTMPSPISSATQMESVINSDVENSSIMRSRTQTPITMTIQCCMSTSNDDNNDNDCGKKEMNKYQGDNCCSNRTPFLHLVFGPDQCFRFDVKSDTTRCRSTSANEDLSLLKGNTKTFKSTGESATAKSECVDQVICNAEEEDKGFLMTLLEFPSFALLKMKEIFETYILGDALYDPKCSLPFLISHAVALVIGVFVGKKMSVSFQIPITVKSTMNFSASSGVRSTP